MRQMNVLGRALKISLLFMVMNGYALAQSETYLTEMTGALAQLDTAASVAGKQQVARVFSQIAEKEKTQWLPYYYAAYSLTRAAVDETVPGRIDPHCDQATAWIDVAESLKGDKSEIAVVRAMIQYAKIPVNFALRAVTNLERAQELLTEAQTLNPENPRVYMLMGQRAFRAPVGFGGGKKEALAYFEKAAGLFEKHPKQPGTVDWGRATVHKLVQTCREQLAQAE